MCYISGVQALRLVLLQIVHGDLGRTEPWAHPTRRLAQPRRLAIKPAEVLRRKEGEDAKVQVWHNVAVSCKGQVWKGQEAKVGCGRKGCGIAWDGCGFSDGTCVWDSDAGRVSKKPYCIHGGICVPHAPGPSEASSRLCKETPELCYEDDPSITGPILQAVVVLTQPMWGEYYHFVVDGLSRVMWLHKQHPEVFKEDDTFFHTGLVTEVAQTWARLVGIDTATGNKNRLIDGWWRAKTAYFPPGNACANMQKGAQPDALQGMQKAVRTNLPRFRTVKEEMEGHIPILLIVRRDIRKHHSRAVLNHDEMVEALKTSLRGWAIEVFSDFPHVPDVLSGCAMFARASLIMGPHGAGFANLICGKPGTPVIEFQQAPHSWDYELLTLKLGMPYKGVSTKMEHDGPGSVDVPAVVEAVHKSLQKVGWKEKAGDGPAVEVRFQEKVGDRPEMEARPPQKHIEAAAERKTTTRTGDPAAEVAEKAHSPGNKDTAEAEGTEVLDEEPPAEEFRAAMKAKRGEDAKVHVWHDVVVSCKGQVFQGVHPLVGCGHHGCVPWDGCSYDGGTCVWDSGTFHGSKEKYCVQGGLCVPHAPGPSESSPEACREQPEKCADEPGFLAGPVGSLVVLTQPQWGAYYHFLIDSLSRIFWIRQQHPELLKDGKTLFHTGMVSGSAQEWARLAGIQTTSNENLLVDGWWKAKVAYFPPGNACANTKVGADIAALRGLRKAALSHLHLKDDGQAPASAGSAPVAMLVKRSATRAHGREVLNHKDVFATLKRLLVGWSLQVFSDSELPDTQTTCSMFHAASLIIGPHGAGFANLICARSGTPLIEFQQKFHSWDYQLMSMKLKLPYFGVRTTMDHYESGDVDLKELEAAVKKVLSTLAASAGAVVGKADLAATKAARGVALAPAAERPAGPVGEVRIGPGTAAIAENVASRANAAMNAGSVDTAALALGAAGPVVAGICLYFARSSSFFTTAEGRDSAAVVPPKTIGASKRYVPVDETS